jgi:hypothetical protein
MTVSLNLFEVPTLTDEEKLNGFIFNSSQMAILKIELVNVIQQLANFTFQDPANLMKGALDHAMLNGQLSIIQMLIDRSEESQQVLLQIAQQQAAQQSSILNPSY